MAIKYLSRGPSKLVFYSWAGDTLEKRKRRGQAFGATYPEYSYTLANVRAGISWPGWHFCASKVSSVDFLLWSCWILSSVSVYFEIDRVLWKKFPGSSICCMKNSVLLFVCTLLPLALHDGPRSHARILLSYWQNLNRGLPLILVLKYLNIKKKKRFVFRHPQPDITTIYG